MAEGYIEFSDIVGEDGYRVKWGTTSGGPYPNSQDAAANVTSIFISPLTAGVVYYAIVMGLVAGVEQDPSAQISFVAYDFTWPTAGIGRRLNFGAWAR